MGLYLAKRRIWYEFALDDGRLLGAWNLPPVRENRRDSTPEELLPTGMALTESGRLIGFLLSDRGGLSGYFELDRSVPAWKRIPGLEQSRHSMLWGAKGERLLVNTGGPSGLDRFEWLDLPPSP